MKRFAVYKYMVDFEKREQWINQMASKGFNLIDRSGIRFLFEEGIPGEYTYRIQFLKHFPSHLESQAYIAFME